MAIWVQLLILSSLTLLLVVCQRVIELKFGRVEGDIVVAHNKSVHKFLGIPFAKPPVGELRFKKPVPWTEIWSGIRPTKRLRKACVQKSEIKSVSEDCLHLNIWTTFDAQGLVENTKPVFVFIHGGGFQSGSSTRTVKDGKHLAVFLDAVIVTINYRLGPLGFAYGGNEDMPANVGLYDQAMALRWIKENVQAFGGDPTAITIAGHSAGGMSISIHLVSPVSLDLFKHAISMGGVAVTSGALTSGKIALKNTKALATVVGCKQDDEGPITSETVDCLRKVEARKLVNEQFNPLVLEGSTHGSLVFPPLIGDEFIPDAPETLAKAGKHNNGSTLFGTVSYEGPAIELFIQNYVEHIKEEDYTPKNLYLEKLRSFLQHLGDAFLNATEDALTMYFDCIPDERYASKVAFYEMLGDIVIQCPVVSYAENLSKRKLVYQYVLKHEVESTACPGFSPCHTDEIGLIFGNTLKTHADYMIWEEMAKVFGGFLRSGQAPWTPYFWTQSGFLVPYFHEFRSRRRREPRQYQYRRVPCLFWNSVWQQQSDLLNQRGFFEHFSNVTFNNRMTSSTYGQ